MLTDEERKEIASRVFANYAGEGDLMLFAERIERAVLARATNQSKCDHDWEDVGGRLECTYPECGATKAMPIPKQEPVSVEDVVNRVADFVQMQTPISEKNEIIATAIRAALKYSDYFNDLYQQPAQAAAIPEPIETAPEDWEFLALSNDGEWLKVHNQADVFKTGKRIVCHGKSGKFWAATHWMPISAPPKQE